MAEKSTFVIVGAGLAGAKAAETLRSEGFDGRVLLLGEEPVRPYERPPLSKEYLRAEKGFEDAAVHVADFYEAHDIELQTATAVEALDVSSRIVALASGESVGYDALLLATGATPRRLSVPGAELSGVYYLRSLADADVLAQLLRPPSRLVVIGGGWIGCEVAASARQLGCAVTVVEAATSPLERVLGPTPGAIYRDVHVEHGVDWKLRTSVLWLSGRGRVERVHLSDDRVVEADVVVVGIGVDPRHELAKAAGLAIDDGVVTDAQLATSAPGVYAAGDVANTYYRRYARRIRLEHWSAALNQGPVAARNMLGQQVEYASVPYFFSDQYDLGMEYRGFAADADQVVIRGDANERAFLAFFLGSGRVRAVMNVNIWDTGELLDAFVEQMPFVDARALADEGVELASLLAPAR